MSKLAIYDELRDTEKRIELARGKVALAVLEFKSATLALEKLTERRRDLKKMLAKK